MKVFKIFQSNNNLENNGLKVIEKMEEFDDVVEFDTKTERLEEVKIEPIISVQKHF